VQDRSIRDLLTFFDQKVLCRVSVKISSPPADFETDALRVWGPSGAESRYKKWIVRIQICSITPRLGSVNLDPYYCRCAPCGYHLIVHAAP
jgi:hypothetical protein